ncbi:pyridoxal-phosphate dependent enzyme [Flavimaricola marinus]|uniref:Threonine synthase n=1 Tax=Flavimaricola marinus TaxID=1819565 RepID=A0A238LGX9_9RHOB|nr:pyridoxal-phosphate dependent enzyme [Flavimaricola marinus]SMY08901.1 Threonine synthase [Flavimaricola marinus]
MPPNGLYERYAEFLPKVGNGGPIDLGQGFTPLVRSRSIGPKAGIADLRFKMEQLNPTGSYKDRFAGLAIGLARAEGAKTCVATSSGNTGAALAAFAASVGLDCALYVSENAPEGKLSQMLAYGAQVYRVNRFTIDPAESNAISELLEAETARRRLPLLITAYAICPLPMEGIKTIAYELHDTAPETSDVFVPVGGGGLHVAVSRGYEDLARSGRLTKRPRIHAVQPSGNDTVATPLRDGAERARPVDTSTTISGLGVGFILDGHQVIEYARTTGGQGYVIDEDEIRTIQRRLAQEEGILVEPAGAVSVAGALAAAKEGKLKSDEPAICILTGHGFKDPETLDAMGSDAQAIGRADIPSTFSDP